MRAEGRGSETLDREALQTEREPSPAPTRPGLLAWAGWHRVNTHWPLSLAAAPSTPGLNGGREGDRARETLVITYRITTNNNHRHEDILVWPSASEGGARSGMQWGGSRQSTVTIYSDQERNLGFVASIVIFISLISHNLCSRENKTCFRTPHT